MNPRTIDLTSTPDILRFTLPGDIHMEFDILEAQYMVEQIYKAYTPEQLMAEPLALTNKVIEWVLNLQGIKLTHTQAWTLAQSIRAAYQVYKKKLNAMLMSLITSTSTPGTLNAPTAPVTSTPSIPNWRERWRSQKLHHGD